MIETLSQDQFVNRFLQVRPDSFSPSALRELYNFYEEMGLDVEFDPVAIDCEFVEYASCVECTDEYSDTFLGDKDLTFDEWVAMDEDEQEQLAEGWLQDHTIVLYTTDDTIVIQQF